MTVHSKTNPVGLDKSLLKIQNKINDIGWDDIDVYGHLYVINKGDRKFAGAYIGNGEYLDVLLNDKKNAVFGFFVDDNRSGLSMIKTPVNLICSCNLHKLFGSSERSDEEALLAVHKIVKRITLIDNETGIKTGFDNVFSNLTQNTKYNRDIQPWFNFSISFDIIYKNEI